MHRKILMTNEQIDTVVVEDLQRSYIMCLKTIKEQCATIAEKEYYASLACSFMDILEYYMDPRGFRDFIEEYDV